MSGPPASPGASTSVGALESPFKPNQGAAATASPARTLSSRPEPGADFGLEVAERLLQRMMKPSLRSSSWHSRGAGSGDRDIPGGGVGGGASAPSAMDDVVGSMGQVVSVAQDEDMSGMLYSSATQGGMMVMGRGADRTHPRGGGSPHAKMVDVLRGQETERRAKEVRVLASSSACVQSTHKLRSM